MYVKILVAVFATVLVVQYLGKNVFVANSPQLRPDAGSMLAIALSDGMNNATTFIARLFRGNKNPQDQLANTPSQKIGNGVYAKSSADGSVKVLEFKLNEIQMVTYVYNVNGKEVPVTVPKDSTPPPQDIVETLSNKK